MAKEDNPALPDSIRLQLQHLGLRRGRELAPPPHPPYVPPAVPSLEGRRVDTGEGTCFVVEESYPLDYRHGTLPLGALLDEPVDPWAALAGGGGERTDLVPASLVFLDIETTGLPDSAATYAFLVGLGRFEGPAFRLYQAFMCSPGEERALLLTVADLLGGASALVTYNGRGFDLPVLHSRYTVARLPVPWAGLAHLDLLLPVRQFFRPRLGECSLSNVEQAMLGVERSFLDMPGWRIPSVYRDYMRGAGPEVLKPVFYHNAQDVLSLVALAARLGRYLRDPFGAGGARHGLEFCALGRFYEQRGQREEAIAAYRAALLLALPASFREETWRRLSFLLKGQRAWAEAVEIWETLLQRAGRAPLYAYIELAKYHEHRSKDLARAETLVERAIAEWGEHPGGEDLARRRERLRRKRLTGRKGAASNDEP